MLQSDWLSTSKILEKNKVAVQTEFPTFCERENSTFFALIYMYIYICTVFDLFICSFLFLGIVFHGAIRYI
jgi:hypothetical protein